MHYLQCSWGLPTNELYILCIRPWFKVNYDGVIDSLPSKLKEVYKSYLNIIQEGEMDIVQCGWPNYRMSEKSLIDYMERRIRGEKVKFPDDYFPFGI